MFTELLPEGKLNLHRVGFVGSPRYHLGLSQSISEWPSNKIMFTAVSPNRPAGKNSFINCLSTIYWMGNNSRKKLKVRKKNIYLMTKCILFSAMAFYFIFYL